MNLFIFIYNIDISLHKYVYFHLLINVQIMFSVVLSRAHVRAIDDRWLIDDQGNPVSCEGVMHECMFDEGWVKLFDNTQMAATYRKARSL